MSFNKFTFTGRLTSDVKQRVVGDNTVYGFGVAINQYQGKDKEEETLFVDCNLWGDTRGKYLSRFGKGTQILGSGRLSLRSYIAKDGSEKTVLNCRIDEYEVFDKPPEQEKPTRTRTADPTEPKVEEVEEEDIPF
jgi:single-strand DNA-binding protein